MAYWKRSISRVLLCAAVVISATSSAGGPDANYLDSIWVSDSDGLTSISSDTGAQRFRDTSLSGASAIAVDERGGIVWVFRRGTLTQLNLAGQKQLVIQVPELDITAPLINVLPNGQALEDLYCQNALAPLLSTLAPSVLWPHARMVVDEKDGIRLDKCIRMLAP
ncbi:MAG TPA: hypothetical protein VGE57_05140 [Solimonas sp.]